MKGNEFNIFEIKIVLNSSNKSKHRQLDFWVGDKKLKIFFFSIQKNKWFLFILCTEIRK